MIKEKGFCAILALLVFKMLFNWLARARMRMTNPSGVILDSQFISCCEMKKADKAFLCFKMMMSENVMPKANNCNELLSSFLKLNWTGGLGLCMLGCLGWRSCPVFVF